MMPIIPSRQIIALSVPFCFLLLHPAAHAQTAQAHFEARLVHPAEITPDGSTLLLLSSTEGRLCVFDIHGAAADFPALRTEIQTGQEPVSVRARSNDEAWVVNEASDSISVISLSKGITTATIPCADEPADVIFAAGRAWVSCARSNLIRVFDPVSRSLLHTIPVPGLYPRALAADASGQFIYTVCLLSGNGTTVIPPSAAPPQPNPSDPSLPPPPRTALIVPATDPRVAWKVGDHDLIAISTGASPAVTATVSGLGTHLFAIAPNPQTGQLWIANSESLNLILTEPALRGRFARHRLSVVSPQHTIAAIHDLNPEIGSDGEASPGAIGKALAQPHALTFEPSGSHLWVAAFATDRIARISAADGRVTHVSDLRPPPAGSRQMRGPRGLALHPTSPRLYALGKLSDSLMVIDTTDGKVIYERPVSSHPALPRPVAEARGFLFDARLSSNGTVSCGTCHLDADTDGLAWDLGDPAGALLTVPGANLSAHDTTPRPRTMHPMKGPMVTQTLRGLQNGAPFHWRGDRPTLQSFNPTFDALLGGSVLPAADMEDLAAYLLTIRHHPNPNRQPDRTLPASTAGGNPVRGRDLYNLHNNHCAICHSLPSGSDGNIDLPQEVGSAQPLKNPSLRTTYQRAFFDPRPGASSRSGFGLGHDGTGFALPTVHPYVLDELATPADFADVAAFVLCFDTGTAPAACRQITVTASTAAAAATELTLLESQARINATSDLAVHGSLTGRHRRFLYDRTLQRYRPDHSAESPLSRQELLAQLGTDDALTFMGTLPGQGGRPGGDRDGDGVPDRSEPSPSPQLSWHQGTGIVLNWTAAAPDWSPEHALSPAGPWLPMPGPIRFSSSSIDAIPPQGPAGFLRLRRTW